MDLEKSLENGQSVLEYALLVAVAIIALLATNFVMNAKEGAFNDHFENMAGSMGAIIY